MIKIISGWSDKGGSTFAFINLTNTLNQYGYDATFYGPHTWHLDKCKSGILDSSLSVNEDDKLICHFIQLPNRPNASKVILSCHEKNLFEVGKIKQYWDKVVFLNEKQRDYHSSYTGDFTILPNLKEALVKKESIDESRKIAGIIGSIDENKQTHLSIQRAFSEGYDKIFLFGNVTDPNYYNSKVKPLMNENVIEYGFEKDKQKMYDMIDAVFLSSKSEVASLVKDECESTGTKFYGNTATDHDVINLTNDEIIKEWIKILEI
jgi:hypothetical protein